MVVRKLVPEESGIALAVALMAIVVIGALVAGAFLFSRQEYRVGRNSLVEERTLAAAEFGQNRALQFWRGDTAAALAIGAVRTRVDTGASGVIVTTWTTKLAYNLFWVVSEAAPPSGGSDAGARRRIGQILHLDQPTIATQAAVTTRTPAGNLTLSGSATVSGIDANPAGWSCAPTGAATGGVALPDVTKITNSSSIPIAGDPPELQTPAANDSSTYFNFGGLTYDSLTAMANIVYAAGANASNPAPQQGSGVCATWLTGTSAPVWGEPYRPPTSGVVPPCYNYFPIIWAKGDFTMSGGGRGQGILLVDGNLTSSGGVAFSGLILAKGGVTLSGGGLKLQGALLAYDRTNFNSVLSGSSVVQYSRCALAAAFAGVTSRQPPRLLKYHAWADMF